MFITKPKTITLHDLSVQWRGIKCHYNTIEEEHKAVMMYVKKNPYPSYNKLCGLLPVNKWVKYRERNHALCKKIYENITNDAKIWKKNNNQNQESFDQCVRTCLSYL